MTDIVERLRTACQKGREDIEPWQCDPFLFDEAADEIERLREEGTVEVARLMIENERLRATVNAQSAAIERADRLVLACEQHLRDAKHEISKLRDDLTDEVL